MIRGDGGFHLFELSNGGRRRKLDLKSRSIWARVSGGKRGKRRRVCGDYIGEVSWAGGKRSKRIREFCGVRSVGTTRVHPGHRPELGEDRSLTMVLGWSGPAWPSWLLPVAG